VGEDFGCSWVIVTGALAVCFFWLLKARWRIRKLELSIAELANADKRLENHLAELRREIRSSRGAAAPGAEAKEGPPEPGMAPVPAALPAPPREPSPWSRDARRPGIAAVSPPTGVPPAAGSSGPPSTPAPGRPPEPPAPPLPVVPAAPPPAPPRFRMPALSFDWESFVGVKLFSWIAGIALALAVIFFLRYSIDHGWLRPPVRMAIGFLSGAALLVLCEWKIARPYAVTANALDASAIAILFSTSFASHALWHLIGSLPAFILMALVTATAVALSIRRHSIFIAILGLLGGFATPALLSTGEDHPFGLFGYLLLLNAGLCWVARRKRWPVLTVLSFGFTALYEWSWVTTFLTPAKLPIGEGIFLVFPLLAVLALPSDPKPGAESLFRHTATAASVVPLLFAIFVAAVPAYGNQYVLLFGFLFCIDAALAVLARVRGPQALHLGAGAATLVVFALWLSTSYDAGEWPEFLVVVAIFTVFYALFPFVRKRLPGPLAVGLIDRGDWTAGFLLFVFPVLAAVEPRTGSPALLFLSLFGLLVILAGSALASESGVVHFAAAFFALAAEAVWSARHLDAAHLIPALFIYAGFALFYLGVPMLAIRLGRKLRPEGSGAIVLLASLGLLFFIAAGPVAQSAFWGLALLLSLLDLGLIYEAISGRRPLLCLMGLALSWILIGTWWAAVNVALLLVPALVLVGGFALLVLGGNVVLEKRGAARGFLLGQGAYLALVGHIFLLFVASQKALAIPPWPLFGVLAVLDLAIGAAALATRRSGLHVGAVIASQFVVLFWLAVASKRPWPLVGIEAAAMVAIFALAWRILARRIGAESFWFDGAAAVALLLAQVAAIAAGELAGAPGVITRTAAHVVLLVLLLALARATEWHVLALAGLVPTTLACFLWQTTAFKAGRWTEELVLATPIYLLYVLYPFLLGRRSGKRIEPYLAAALAGLPYLLLARHALLAGGLKPVIGLLPLGEASLMALLMVRLLRLEPPGERSLDRLALVGGAALAFLTVAIPMQLDKEWITIGWAMLGAALAWLYGKVPHRGLLAWSGALMLAVFVRLALNQAVWSYHPRGAYAIWNWYLYTYLAPALAFYVAAWLLVRTRDRIWTSGPRLSALACAGATVLLFFLVNIEIADYYSRGATLTFNFLSSSLAQDLSYTLAWALFATGLLAAGIVGRSRAARLAAIVLLVVTVAKCFLHDLARLGGLYRVASFVGLAVALALVAVLLQRFVLAPGALAEGKSH
jgi:Predicted membrane protein (DUF2339)